MPTKKPTTVAAITARIIPPPPIKGRSMLGPAWEGRRGVSKCHQGLRAAVQKPPANNSKQPTFAVYACSHATMGEFGAKFCHGI